MAAKKKRDRQPAAEQDSSSLLTNLAGGGIALLCVVTPLVSSEGAPQRGAELWLAVGWGLALVIWGATAIIQPKLKLRWSWPEWCLSGFLVWLAISTWFVSGEGNLRSAFNSFWDYAQVVVAFFLIRQWVVTDAQRHALLSVMICLAVFISTYGIYEYQFVVPAQQDAYRANPEQFLNQFGIDTTEGNPMRELFENRLLGSTEPTATFTLTNSLAGFLVPWILMSLGWLKNSLWDGPNWKRVGGLCLAVALVTVCLLLTKSRTAWLATLFGMGLLMLYGTTIGRRVSWLIPAAGLSLILGLFMLGFVTGILDVEVLSEAPKSVLYRLQYWQGAAAIIAHHPLFGCGLGNFQGYYPEYMLPMASETVADPHNFVFEIWASAGTPAIVLLLAAFVFWTIRLARHPSSNDKESASDKPSPPEPSASPIWIGAAIAPLVAPLLQVVMQEMTPDFLMLLIGLPPAILVAALLQGQPIVKDLRLWLVIAVSALAIDLLAAGGISFPSVAGSFFLLAALASPAKPKILVEDWKFKCLPIFIGAIGVFVVIVWGVQPSTARRTQLGLATYALQRGAWQEADQRAQKATEADPWSKDGPMLLAELYHGAWIHNTDATLETRQPLLEAFEESLNLAVRRAGHSFPLHYSAGNWFLDIYRQSNSPTHIVQAIDHYRRAVELYPNNAMHHAQLAWALHLAGMNEESIAQAKEALRLDALNPHSERRLEDRLKIHDPGPDPSAMNQLPPPDPGIYAKQVMENLLTMGG